MVLVEDRASRCQVRDYRSVGTMREPSLAVLLPGVERR